ncbi:MATE family efflux transporter [Photobacterium ganghwense]|uniref:Multidrug resistance protein NorM n=1 Tax=Photobacterium ganghwense TaxID=320778 RepID=A0A0J1HEU8_9GAMM|nr:MATE family efflux transporter [Photobacterium ganghwense]KLV10126.1 multidrug transporter MatE [Photobacterium ganghwense]PSU05371.1 MATE family efflux transporter [Photobacterium ganghwense]QSV17253.1 MATE family efflux transporter [Photobacterium ganghwense]
MTTTDSKQSALPPGLFGKITRLAFPVAIQSALVAILALADVLMVSDLGQSATAAVGIASKWHFVAIMIMAGLAGANGVLVSQYWGQNDKVHAKTVTLQAMKFGCAIMVPVTIIITVFALQIMQLQTNDSDVIFQGAQYLWYSFPVLILTHIIITAESSMRASGDAFMPLLLATVTIALNIGLNFLFIKGGWGIPAMGVAGAALATTISRFAQVLMIWGVLAYRRHWLLVSRAIPRHQTLWYTYRKLAIPQALGSLLWAVGTLTYQIVFGHMGTTELAVFSMLGPFEGLLFSIFMGISVACSVLIGHSLGRNEFDQAQAMTIFFIKFVLILGIGIGFCLFINREFVLHWLNLDNNELLAYSSPAMIVISLGISLKMMNMVIINAILRAGGENMFCLRMDFIAMWMVGIPVTTYGAFIGQWDFGWVYLAMLSEEVVKLWLCFNRYLKKRWMNNLTVQPQPASV